ncbi:MAG: hypothetical protein ACXVUL_05000 [Solirubrobacteraceae bacterium]
MGGERYVIEITEFALWVFHHGLVTYLRRQVSLPAHGAIAVLLGMVMFLAPAVLHFQVAGLVLAATLGAIEIGFGLTFIAPGTYATAWRAHLDSLLAVSTAAAALGVAAAGDTTTAIFLAVMTAVQVCLNLGTRYVEAA